MLYKKNFQRKSSQLIDQGRPQSSATDGLKSKIQNTHRPPN